MKLLFCLTLFLNIALAQEIKIIQPTKELPAEVSLIYQSYQNLNSNPNVFQKLLQISYQIDTYSPLLSKEDLYFIIKSEIYKTILRNGDSVKIIINPDDLNLIYENIKKCDDPFLKWIQLSLASDARNIFNGKNYREYVLQNANGRLDTVIAKKTFKKLQILSRLFSQFNVDSSQVIKQDLQILIEKILNNVIQSLYIMSIETKFDKLPNLIDDPNKLKFFKLDTPINKSMAKTSKQSEKSVEDILEDDTPPQKLPIPIEEDWSDDKNSPIDLKKLPKPTNDADWLQDI